jgi:alcohol dehydrogenase
MVPFDFQPRTRVVFAPGAIKQTGELARDLGLRKALVVADRGIQNAGHTAPLIRALETAGVQPVVFGDFDVNPDSEMVEAGRAFADRHKVDSIIGLGGGSALDCAKGISFLVTNGGRISDYRGYGKAAEPLLPMIGIPTTSGTGSEAQSYAVISDAGTHMKMACGDPTAAFRIAILDPDLTGTAPRQVTAMAGFDAIAHAVETAVTLKRNALSDTFSHKAWKLLTGAYERVLVAPADSEARGAMMIGSYFAGMAIEQSMLGAAHACANPLTAKFNLPHGLALAILLPHVVRWNAPAVKNGYAALLGTPRRRTLDEDPGETLARRLEDIAAAGNLAMTLSKAGIDASAIPGLADLAAQQWTGSFNPRPLTAAGAAEIYRAAL